MRAKLSKPFSIHDIKYKGHADERFKGKRLELHSDFKTALNFAKDLTWCILNMKCHIMSRSLVNIRKKKMHLIVAIYECPVRQHSVYIS